MDFYERYEALCSVKGSRSDRAQASFATSIPRTVHKSSWRATM